MNFHIHVFYHLCTYVRNNIDVTIEVEVMKSLPQKIEQLLLASRNMWYTLLEEYFETLTWKKREKKRRRKEACVYVCMYVYIH